MRRGFRRAPFQCKESRKDCWKTANLLIGFSSLRLAQRVLISDPDPVRRGGTSFGDSDEALDEAHHRNYQAVQA